MDSAILQNSDQFHINELLSKDSGSKHFCTGSKSFESASESEFSTKLKICEKYKPSYTSKEDQIKVISDRIKMLRESKELMRETMKSIDGILDDRYKINNSKTDYDLLEEFFKNKNYVHGSLHITSLNSNLPRKDIHPPKHAKTFDCKHHQNKTEKADLRIRSATKVAVVPTSVFEPFDESTFTDKTILENRKRILENKRKTQLKKRPILSAGFSLVNIGKSFDSDRSINNKIKKLVLTKSRINSAH
jgi:hypothetical protein